MHLYCTALALCSAGDCTPVLYCTVQYSGELDAGGEPGVMTWAQLMLLGRAQADTELDTRLGDIAANQCAALCYTSGTTGNPKVI